MLPQGFPERMLHLLGEAEFAEFLASYERPRSAGLRLNPRKPLPDGASLQFCEAQVPWEPNGYYVCEGGPAAARQKNKSKYLKKVVDKTARTRYNNHACLRRRYSSAGRAADL